MKIFMHSMKTYLWVAIVASLVAVTGCNQKQSTETPQAHRIVLFGRCEGNSSPPP